MCISGDTLHAFFVQLKENAGHCRAEVVGAGCEQCFVYRGDQCIGRGSEAGGIICNRFLGEIVGVFAHDFVFPVIAGDLDAEIFVDVECERLIGEVFERVDQNFGRNTNTTGFFRIDINLNAHDRFQVCCHDGELIFIDLKQKIFQDGQYGVCIDHTGDVLKLTKECSGVYQKFHVDDLGINQGHETTYFWPFPGVWGITGGLPVPAVEKSKHGSFSIW